MCSGYLVIRTGSKIKGAEVAALAVPRPYLSVSVGAFLVPLEAAAGALEDLTFEPERNFLQLQVP